jgi:hypothetical protein
VNCTFHLAAVCLPLGLRFSMGLSSMSTSPSTAVCMRKGGNSELYPTRNTDDLESFNSKCERQSLARVCS